MHPKKAASYLALALVPGFATPSALPRHLPAGLSASVDSEPVVGRFPRAVASLAGHKQRARDARRDGGVACDAQSATATVEPSVSLAATAWGRRRRIGAEWRRRSTNTEGCMNDNNGKQANGRSLIKRENTRYTVSAQPPLVSQIRTATLSLAPSPAPFDCPETVAVWDHGEKYTFVSRTVFSLDLCGEKAVIVTPFGTATATVVGQWNGPGSAGDLKMSEKVWEALGRQKTGSWFMMNPNGQGEVQAVDAGLSGILTRSTNSTSVTSTQSVALASSTSLAASSAPSLSPAFTGGWATFFYQENHAGACGKSNPESASIVALDYRRYGDTNKVSAYCGRTVEITRVSTGKTIAATVADACPTCSNNNSLDLSIGAFKQIATTEEGMVEITWKFA